MKRYDWRQDFALLEQTWGAGNDARDNIQKYIEYLEAEVEKQLRAKQSVKSHLETCRENQKYAREGWARTNTENLELKKQMEAIHLLVHMSGEYNDSTT